MSYTFDQLKEAIDKNHSTRQDLIKNLLTIASAMLAILASFHTISAKSEYTAHLYLSTLALLSIGILAGGITLYFDTVAAKTIYLRLKDAMVSQLKDPGFEAKAITYNPPKLFYFCEKICYISLMLSVVSLASYAALK